MSETKLEILRLAEQLARAHGFNGFSYKDIADRMGIKPAAIHYHFPTKADLGVALIHRYRELLLSKTRDFMKDGGQATVQLEGLFRFYLRDSEVDTPICPMGSVAVDYFNVTEETRREGERLAREMITWMTRVLELGREQGEFEFDGPAADKAIVVLATLQGAAQIARMAGTDRLAAAMDQIRRDLKMNYATV